MTCPPSPCCFSSPPTFASACPPLPPPSCCFPCRCLSLSLFNTPPGCSLFSPPAPNLSLTLPTRCGRWWGVTWCWRAWPWCSLRWCVGGVIRWARCCCWWRRCLARWWIRRLWAAEGLLWPTMGVFEVSRFVRILCVAISVSK